MVSSPSFSDAFGRSPDGRLHTPVLVDTPWQRLCAYSEMYFRDHGILRSVYLNLHCVSDGLYRSAQPSPAAIGYLARCGIRTIINLRGARPLGTYALEKEACARHGIALTDFRITSGAPPSRETLRKVEALFSLLRYPAVVHCKSGADRSGLMSALYLLIAANAAPQKALDQLCWQYGHLRSSKQGILTSFILAYEKANRIAPIPFMEWVNRDYDPDRIRLSFERGALFRLVQGNAATATRNKRT